MTARVRRDHRYDDGEHVVHRHWHPGVQHGADAKGATLVVSSIGDLPQGWTTSALDKASVDIFSPDGTKIFTVTLNPAGGYTVTQHEARPGTTESINLDSAIANKPQSSYDLATPS